MTPQERLHQLASHPPKFDMTWQGAKRWNEYEAACKEAERAIKEE